MSSGMLALLALAATLVLLLLLWRRAQDALRIESLRVEQEREEARARAEEQAEAMRSRATDATVDQHELHELHRIRQLPGVPDEVRPEHATEETAELSLADELLGPWVEVEPDSRPDWRRRGDR